MSEEAVPLPVYINIQKWQVTFFFSFHGKLYIIVDAIQVVQEVLEFFLTMWPDNLNLKS
jgi:hypothetical protein